MKRKKILILIGLVLIILGFSLGIYKFIKYRNSFEYKLIEVGYTKEETKEIIDIYSKDEIKHIITLDYDKNIIDLKKQTYFIFSNLENYLIYKKVNNDEKIENVIAIINVGSNQKWYSEPKKVNVTEDNKYTILVNKFNFLDKDYTPDNLSDINLQYAYADNKTVQTVYQSFVSMYKSAIKEDLKLIINYSYRSYQKQEEIYNNYTLWYGEEYADNYAARPGFSEHQTGLSLDIDAYGNKGDFEITKEFIWLQENAYKYGFILRYPKDKEKITGYKYEPWHYRYVGLEIAKEIYEKNITYDEYYAYYIERNI